ncbi:hypothetical protein AWC02_14125 [Mycolicibacter engbaekii]|uniref:GP55 protein n=1 Tax=Mycolicibacter engbaekii TaxID=188915 RepID=A0A1X1TKR9_9MYCO|nr:hypothetical protein [Mycolicibacter engbaekii]ORV45059.1 hypothetical protein AWC02_14125 [Mycolicibacter engbaekii]
MLISAIAAATLAIVGYCLWVRRDTWRSRWEAGATFAIAMEGCALFLLTPWAATQLGPALHSLLGLWNVQQVAGWLCLIAGVMGNIYHMLVRLTAAPHVWPVMRKHLLVPVGLGIAVMLVAFFNSEREFEPDMFIRLNGDRWLTAFEVAAGALLLFLSGYVGRLMVALRPDHRARATLVLYLAAMAFAVTACVVAIISIAIGRYAGPVIWVCVCLSVGIFAYGLARSWQAKKAWFRPNRAAASDECAPRDSNPQPSDP